MSKALKKVTICGMALMMSGILNVSQLGQNNIHANAAKIHRNLHQKSHQHLIAVRMKSTYQNFKKMGYGHKHAVALTDLAAYQNPSMKSNANHHGAYGYYQLPKKVVAQHAKENNTSMISLQLQTSILFQTYNHKHVNQEIKHFKNKQGTIKHLTKYMYKRYFDPKVSNTYNGYNKPLPKVLNAVQSDSVKVPKVQNTNPTAHKNFKKMIKKEIQDNHKQKQQKATHRVTKSANVNTDNNSNDKDNTGAISENVPSDGEMSWTPSNVPSDVKPFIHDPKSVGMDFGTGSGWSDPGGECVNFANSYFHNIWGIHSPSFVMGNGIDIADSWSSALSGGQLSSTPHAGAVGSTSQTALTGGNPAGHTFVVEHVFANGDALVAEENWPSESGDDNSTPNTWNFAVFSKSLMSQNMKFYMPNTKAYHLNWGHGQVNLDDIDTSSSDDSGMSSFNSKAKANPSKPSKKQMDKTLF